MSNNTKLVTWRDLVELSKTLTLKFLDRPVTIQTADEILFVEKIGKCPETTFDSNSGYAITYDDLKNNTDPENFKRSDYPVINYKDEPFLQPTSTE